MRYPVLEVTFNKPIPALGSGGWYAKSQGKFMRAEFDTQLQWLTLFPKPELAELLKPHRVPAANIAHLVVDKPFEEKVGK